VKVPISTKLNILIKSKNRHRSGCAKTAMSLVCSVSGGGSYLCDDDFLNLACSGKHVHFFAHFCFYYFF